MTDHSVFASSPCREWFRKVWHPEFLEDHNPAEDETHVELRLPLDPAAGDDHLLNVLQDYEDDGPVRAAEVDEIVNYCKGVTHSALSRHDPHAQKSAWLDDRSWNHHSTTSQGPNAYVPTQELSSRNEDAQPEKLDSPSQSPRSHLTYRKYQLPLSATTLCGHLKQKRFDHAKLPDADRRLIYIEDLSPLFVIALIETVPPHQVPALNEILFKYLALQTSMIAKVSCAGFRVFQLDFHMPFYVLRAQPKEYIKDDVHTRPPRAWKDLSFLASSNRRNTSYGPLVIQETQFSLTICGPAESHWTGYAFADTIDEDNAMDENEFNNDSMHPDPFSSDGAVDANRPIWNPREYYLLIVHRRLIRIGKEWSKLVRFLEKSIRQRIKERSPKKSFASMLGDDGDAMAIYDWTQKTLELLSELIEGLRRTNDTWKRFASSDGDIGYYYSGLANVPKVSREHIQLYLLDIKRKFEELEDFQKRLETVERLCQGCQKSARGLHLHLARESAEASRLSGSTSELMISVISPAAIVSAFFAIPQPFVSFQRDGKSFAAAIIVVTFVLQLLLFVKRGRKECQSLCRNLLASTRPYSDALKRRATWSNLRKCPSRSTTEANLGASIGSPVTDV